MKSSPLGSGLYFIDVLACLLFALSLALVGARFGHERTLAVDLPDAPTSAPGADLEGPAIVVRSDDQGGVELFLDEAPVSLDELAARLGAAPPPAVVVRSEDSPLARVIAVAHGAGVHDIQIAYEGGPATTGAAP